MKIPFSWPHDHELAGLRDYRAQIEEQAGAYRLLRWALLVVAVVALLVFCAITLIGCVGFVPAHQGHYTPEPIHPSPERIAELAALTDPPAVSSRPWLRLSSPFVVAGGAVRLSCFVPRSTPNLRALQLGLVDELGPVGVAGIEQVNYRERLIESVPCGSYTAVCDALGPGDPPAQLLHLEQRFLSRGSCNADGDRSTQATNHPGESLP